VFFHQSVSKRTHYHITLINPVKLRRDMKTALITGITGQDGPYLAAHLLANGYRVHGTYRRLSTPNFWRLHALGVFDKVQLKSLDLSDSVSTFQVFRDCKYDEVYNLAAHSFVGGSFEQPLLSADNNALGVLRLLESIRSTSPKTKFYQASTSEMFGDVGDNIPQNESTVLNPRSPYASAKVFAHHTVANYRDAYNLFCCSGILFNHESPLRGLEFVTRKITNAVARIKLGKQEKLNLGNLDAKRDWGHAKDYVKAMHLMLQQDRPDDYVIATGEMHTVREFCELAFQTVGLNYKDYVVVDQRFMRPSEVNLLLGDASKAKKVLGWTPSIYFKDLVKEMVEEDLRRWKELPSHWDAPNAGSWESIIKTGASDR